MRQSTYFAKTFRKPPADEESANAKFLTQAGFVKKLAAGVYTFLPLGWRVLNKIENIVREEINKAGGQEIFMPALHPKKNWEATGRWESFDALFRLQSKSGSEYALGPTHEEVLYDLLTSYIKSYKDLSLALYQVQTKFRDEPRAKSGLLRGREFRMKDLYSFHADDNDRDHYYETVKKAYLKIFKRLGLDAILTTASGGTFSELSAEFQVISPAGEDTIFVCENCRHGFNKEILVGAISGFSQTRCAECGGKLKEEQGVELGNIFPLKEQYAKDFNLIFKDKSGNDRLVSAGCYGLGTSRAMGAIVEVHHDDKGIIWPEQVAPFRFHLIALLNQGDAIKKEAEKLYRELVSRKIEVLYDDRPEASAGEKFQDADLIGIPFRVVLSKDTLAKKKVELKKRGGRTPLLVSAKTLYGK